MKLNLEVDIDWIDEEMGIDETIKQNVIDTIVKRIQSKIEKKTTEAVDKIIDKTIVDKVNEKTDDLFNDFINKPITITDGYGDILNQYDSINDLIKNRFDNFMTQSVDDKGRTDDSRYGTKYKRLEYIIDKQLKDFAEKFTTDAVKKVSEEIKIHVKDGLTTKLGSELMTVLKVDKMLELKN